MLLCCKQMAFLHPCRECDSIWGICVKLCTCQFWQCRAQGSVSSLPSSPAASLLPSCLPLFSTVLTLKAAPLTCCLSYLSEGCRRQSSHKRVPETCGKLSTVEEEAAGCCCWEGFDFCWTSAQIEWFDLCFVVDLFSPKRSLTMKSQAMLAALQVAPGHSSSTVYLLKQSKQTLGSTSLQLEPLREGKGAAAERCSSEGKGTLIPRFSSCFQCQAVVWHISGKNVLDWCNWSRGCVCHHSHSLSRYPGNIAPRCSR